MRVVNIISASKNFKILYKSNTLETTYFTKIAHKTMPGIDKINRELFERELKKTVLDISKRVKIGAYKFVPYKEKLIPKGRGKVPRVISIPTIRDKLTLNVLNEVLTSAFSKKITTKLTQNIIDDLKKAIQSGHFDYFIKIDIEAFYDNINQSILLGKIKRKIRKTEILDLITKSIKNPTIIAGSERIEKMKGVPQGISISNILANIYLSDTDKFFLNKKSIQYFRYVDDILILCKEKHKTKIKQLIEMELCKKLILTINEKEDEGKISKGFDYLGYRYKLINKVNNEYGFSVKKSNLQKLENSLIKIFAEYKKDKKGQKLLWNLNLRITGFILDDRKYGWIFFYSQIDDLSRLYHLDWFIENKLCVMHRIPKRISIRIKKFVKAYFEIVKKRGKSSYIPRSEDMPIEEQKRILVDIFEYDNKFIDNLSEKDVKIIFRSKMFIFVKDLERDVQSFS